MVIHCKKHMKEIQAFCADEHELLCIECLIKDKNKHREHQIMSLDEAVLYERQILAEKAEHASRLESNVSGKILQLK